MMAHHAISRVRGLRAFSLIEVAFSLAVIAFALVGLLALFPLAQRTSLESQRETTATLISRQIISDIQSGTKDARFLMCGPDLTDATSRVEVSYSIAGTNRVAYDENGRVLDLAVTETGYLGGIDGEARHLAQIGITPDTPESGLTRLEIVVETPALAPSSNRSRYVFVTLARTE